MDKDKMRKELELNEEAWDLYEDAMEEGQESKRKKLLKQALKKKPDFIQAKLALVEMEADAVLRMKKLQQLKVEEEKRLEEAGLMEEKGDFYQIIETRPYIRLCYSIFEEYLNKRQLRLAMKEGEEILVYNESDNMGVRHSLMGIYCCLEEFEKAEALLNQYPEFSVPMLLYQSILFYRKDDLINFHQKLQEVAELVPEVSDLPSYEMNKPSDLEYLALNSIEEVMYFMARFPELFLSDDLMEELLETWVNAKKYEA